MTGYALGHQTTIVSPISGPPDYSFSLGSLVNTLDRHSKVGRTAAVTVRVFVFNILGGG